MTTERLQSMIKEMYPQSDWSSIERQLAAHSDISDESLLEFIVCNSQMHRAPPRQQPVNPQDQQHRQQSRSWASLLFDRARRLVSGGHQPQIHLQPNKVDEDYDMPFECSVCYNRVDENVVTCQDGHVVCFQCVRQYAQQVIYGQLQCLDDGSVACPCIDHQCQFVIASHEIDKALDNQLQRQLTRHLMLKVGQQNGLQAQECQNCHDIQFYRRRKLQWLDTLRCFKQVVYDDRNNLQADLAELIRTDIIGQLLVLLCIWYFVPIEREPTSHHQIAMVVQRGLQGNGTLLLFWTAMTVALRLLFYAISYSTWQVVKLAVMKFQSLKQRVQQFNLDQATTTRCQLCKLTTCHLCSMAFLMDHECAAVKFKQQQDDVRTFAVTVKCQPCQRTIVKDGGCNLIHCRCKRIYCYVCKRDITATQYRHFCQHFRADGERKCAYCEKCDLFKFDQAVVTDQLLIQHSKQQGVRVRAQ